MKKDNENAINSIFKYIRAFAIKCYIVTIKHFKNTGKTPEHNFKNYL